jgi:hypothetical protein
MLIETKENVKQVFFRRRSNYQPTEVYCRADAVKKDENKRADLK